MVTPVLFFVGVKNFKHFILHEVSQLTELDLCGVPHHPSAVVTTGDQYCQEALHHLTGIQFFKIKRHLTKVFSGTVGTGYLASRKVSIGLQ